MVEADEVSNGATQHFLHKQHAEHVLSRLCELQKREELCDVSIVVDGRAITAHRAVLAASSLYFEAMFTGKMSERTKEKVEIKEVDPESTKALINFAYTAQLTITSSNAQNLFLTSDLLQFKVARDACLEFIARQLDITNCLGMRALAERHLCAELFEASTHCVTQNFTEVVQTEEFKALPLKQVIELVSRNDLGVADECEVFKACVVWIEHDLKNRKSFMLDFLNVIRLGFVAPKRLHEEIAPHYLVKDDPFCQDIISEARKRVFKNVGECMRDSYAETLYIVGGETSFMKEVKSIERFNTKNAQWELVKPMNEARASFTVATLDGRLYVIGGYRRGRRLNSMECYDPVKNTWKCLPCMNKCQGDTRAAVLGGKIYVAGGSSDGLLTCNYVERFSPLTQRWEQVSSMLRKRRRFALAVLNSHMYAVGGFDDSMGDLNHVEHYDPETNTWSEDAPMLCCRYDFGAVALSGLLYAVGGANGRKGSLKSVERFDPEKKQWSMVAPLRHCRGGVSVAVLMGKIFAINGMNEYMSIVDTIECYNEVEDKWANGPSNTHTARFSAAAVVYAPVIPADAQTMGLRIE